LAKGEDAMLKSILDAMKTGQQLDDPAKWKGYIELLNKIYGVLLSLVTTIRVQSPDFIISDIWLFFTTVILTVILLIVNMYFNRATTKKEF
jgi:hypothetical protein